MDNFWCRTKYAINWLWLLTNKNKNNIKKLKEVIAFKEKPNKEKAQNYIDEGYYWNSGIFL